MKSIIDETVTYSKEGYRYYPVVRSYLLVFRGRVIKLLANNYDEMNEYVKEHYSNEVKGSFAILDITGHSLRIEIDRKYTNNILKALSTAVSDIKDSV